MFKDQITITPQSDAMHKTLMADLQQAYKTCATFDKLRELEHKEDSPVQFPLVAMYEFSKAMYVLESVIPDSLSKDLGTYSIEFDRVSTSVPRQDKMYSVSIHCQYKRFEAFIECYGATITRANEHDNALHVSARVLDDVMGWLELRCIYRRPYLQVNPQSTFQDVDSLKDLFMIRALSRDWRVDENVRG